MSPRKGGERSRIQRSKEQRHSEFHDPRVGIAEQRNWTIEGEGKKKKKNTYPVAVVVGLGGLAYSLLSYK